MKTAAILTALTLPLAACNQNTAVGNDREAQIEAAPTPSPIMGAAAALQNVSIAIIKPETMSNADIQALGGKPGRCEVILTEVAFPSFLYKPGGQGAIKLNGKLIPLSSIGPNRFYDGGLTVSLSLLDEEGNAGSQGMQMVVVPPAPKTKSAIVGTSVASGTRRHRIRFGKARNKAYAV